jgi:hypothetical protein
MFSFSRPGHVASFSNPVPPNDPPKPPTLVRAFLGLQVRLRVCANYRRVTQLATHMSPMPFLCAAPLQSGNKRAGTLCDKAGEFPPCWEVPPGARPHTEIQWYAHISHTQVARQSRTASSEQYDKHCSALVTLLMITEHLTLGWT